MKKAIAIMKKDFQEIKRNMQVLGVIILMPIIFGLVYPLIIFFLAPAIIAESPESLYYLINLFSGFFLIMAIIIPTVIASDSFAGEKERKTIEALLAAPVSDSELFLGKVLVSFLPAVLLTYLSTTIYCILINLGLQKFVLPNLEFVFILILVPLFALLGVEVTVFISVRVKGFREAQQLAGAIIVPVLIIIVLNAFNISIFVFPWNILLLGGLIAADIGLYGLAIKKFGRENIITKI
ncbi:MAG TPA: ABC transporter permease subunit [Candidatus Deferrimicrobium sp.]|nr:ABC transporter permease subunit [Candidatus Deferrimicrobium sp.]